MPSDETVYRLGDRGKARAVVDITPVPIVYARLVGEGAKNGFGATKHLAIGINQLNRILIMLVRNFGESVPDLPRRDVIDVFRCRMPPASNPEPTKITIGIVNHQGEGSADCSLAYLHPLSQNH